MLTMLLLAPVLVPLLGALVHQVAGWRPATVWVGPVSAALVLADAIALAGRVVAHGPLAGVAGMIRVDALAAFLLIVIGAVSLLTTAATPAWARIEIENGHATTPSIARHAVLVQVFLAAMALAVQAANLGVVWVAIEATTIATAFLVGQRHTKRAVEAAWKYVVICSTGIALALLGILLLGYAAAHTPDPAGLDWTALAAVAGRLDPGVTRIAVALMILGFGAKAGLAPLHAWLPDAYGQAPAPVSALMSGVLSAVALSVILRVQSISNAALGPGFGRTLLAVLAGISLLLAASLLIKQREYPRMVAYSSIEHMGLMGLGAAVGGPLALTAVLLHILGHGLAKSSMFLSAGHVLALTGTRRIDGVRGLAGRHPVLAGCLGFGVLALIGLPPFSLFASEIGIVRSGFAAGLGVVVVPALLLVLVIAAFLLAHTSRMLLGSPDGDGAAESAAAPAFSGIGLAGATPLLLGLVACAALGVTAGPLTELLTLAANGLAP